MTGEKQSKAQAADHKKAEKQAKKDAAAAEKKAAKKAAADKKERSTKDKSKTSKKEKDKKKSCKTKDNKASSATKNHGMTLQRNKLRLVAKMMKGGKSPEPNTYLDADESSEFNLLRVTTTLKNCNNKAELEALGLVVDLTNNGNNSSGSDDDLSTSTHTTSEMDGTFHSCKSTGSASGYSAGCSSTNDDASSVSSARSFLSRTNVAALPLQVMNTWDVAKQIDGHVQDLAEHLIIHMIRLCPDRDIRKDVGIKSFRTKDFQDLAASLVDTVDVLVTMLGPEVDDYELLEMGDDLEDKGVQPELFCTALTCAMSDLLGGETGGFPKDVREAWDQAFACVARRMTG